MIEVLHRAESGQVTRHDSYRDLPAGGWTWIDMVDESTESMSAVGRHLGIDESAMAEANSTSRLPLIDEYSDYLFLVLHGLTHGTGERMSTPEIDIFLSSSYLVTIRDGSRLTLDVTQERITEDGTTSERSPAQLLANMALVAARRYGPLIHELQRQADALEEQAIRAEPQTVIEVHALRRDIIVLRQAISPQLDAYSDLAQSNHPAIDSDARRLIGRVVTQHERALESLEAGRALLMSVLEIYRGALADQSNEIMRVLTVFSAILLPLGLIAGLWGMNFLNIPGAEATDGFWWLLGAMAVLAIGLWTYFSRRGFIGAPRLRDLPKAVGLGLFNLGTAPIRAFTEGIRHLGRQDS